jgi:Dienelactone hydrolase family
MTTDHAALDQPGYLAEPCEGGPGVLLVHDYYGLLPSVREQADALAAAGFVALAPDLYDGRVAADDHQAERLMDELRSRRPASGSARRSTGSTTGWRPPGRRGRLLDGRLVRAHRGDQRAARRHRGLLRDPRPEGSLLARLPAAAPARRERRMAGRLDTLAE